QKPSITTPIADRIRLVSAALDVGNAHLGSDGQFSGASTTFIVVPDASPKFYLQMAAFDIATNGTQFYRPLLKLFSLAEGIHANFSPPNSGEYGYAAAKAYAAYKDPAFLQFAVDAWAVVRQYTLSQEDVSVGTISVKSFPIVATCLNSALWFRLCQFINDISGTMAGVTFHVVAIHIFSPHRD
ncbi:hypothetical protein B0H19DRAFT_931580, partial [Mycena capillaripes]